MRWLFSIAGIVFLILGGATHSPAFRTAERVGEVTVEVNFGNGEPVQRFKVPVVSAARKRKNIEDQLAGGEWGSTGSCHRKICRHGIWITADALGTAQVSVRTTLTFQFEDGRKCEVTKEFRVASGKSAERKMKCRNAKANVRLSYQ